MIISSKEKILLIILAVVLVLFGGIKWLVVPAYEGLKSDAVSGLTLRLEQKKAQMDVSSAAGIESGEKTALNKASKAASSLLPSVDADQVNVWLANMAASKSLTVTDITFSQPESADIGAVSSESFKSAGSSPQGSVSYKMGDSVKAYKGDSSSALSSASSSTSSSAASSSSPAGSKGEGTVIALPVSMTLTGSSANIYAFFDALKSTGKTVAVNSFDLSTQNDVFTASISLTCYGAEKPDGGDKTFVWNLPAPAGQGSIM